MQHRVATRTLHNTKEAAFSIMTSFLLLVVCAVLGMITARTVKGAAGFAQPLNWWVLNIALPALVLELLPNLEVDWNLWYLIVTQWLIFIGAWAGFAMLGRTLKWSNGRIGTLTLMAGLGNTLFLGYPVVEAVLGREGLPYAVIADQGGVFVTFVIGGAFVTAIYGPREGSVPVPLLRLVRQKLVRIPSLYALVIGLVVGELGGWPADFDAMLLRIGATLSPIALFSAGLQFRFRLDGDQRAPLLLGLGWKLLLAPVLTYVIGTAAGIGHLMLSVGVLQAAMPPMVSAAILATQNDLEPPLANSLLALGMLLSVVTVSIAVYLL
jgi:malate permease and related proteins